MQIYSERIQVKTEIHFEFLRFYRTFKLDTQLKNLTLIICQGAHMLNGHSIKLPNKAKSLQVSAALRLIREVCVVHSGERKNSQLVKEQRLSAYGVSSNKWDIFIISFSCKAQGPPRTREVERL